MNCNLGPFISVNVVIFVQQLLLAFRPLVTLDVWIKLIVPAAYNDIYVPFTALLACASGNVILCFHNLGHLAPLFDLPVQDYVSDGLVFLRFHSKVPPPSKLFEGYSFMNYIMSGGH